MKSLIIISVAFSCEHHSMYNYIYRFSSEREIYRKKIRRQWLQMSKVAARG